MKIVDDFTNCENDVRVDGKVALVTGSTSGVGVEIAKNLAQRGARVILASRSVANLLQTRETIINATGNNNIVGRQVNFESLDSIRNFAHEMYMFEPKINILINNIGAIGLEDKLSGDNLNLMMQVNYFGTFLLTFLLFPLLKTSAPSRIVNVSSLALILGEIDLNRWNNVEEYSNFGVYCNAKLAEVLFTVEMNKRIEGSGVNIYSMDPGLGKTDFFRNFNESLVKTFLRAALLKFGRPIDRVATMSVFLAIDPRVENSSGKHFRDCAEYYSSWFAENSHLTRSVWRESKRLVRITYDEDWDIQYGDFK